MSDSIAATGGGEHSAEGVAVPTRRIPADTGFAQMRHQLKHMLRGISPQYQSKFDASDIIQQTMLEACERFSDYEGGTDAELHGWLRRMLSHNLLDAVRRFRSQKRNIARETPLQLSRSTASSGRIEPALSQTSPSGRASRQEELSRVIAAISRLPDKQAEAVRLHHLDGRTLAEIAALMQCSRGAVAGLLHRGLRTLQNEVSEQQ